MSRFLPSVGNEVITSPVSLELVLVFYPWLPLHHKISFGLILGFFPPLGQCFFIAFQEFFGHVLNLFIFFASLIQLTIEDVFGFQAFGLEMCVVNSECMAAVSILN